MTLRPSDIALSLSADARDILQACSAGYYWRATLTGAPFELMQSRLIDPKTAGGGKGYEITPTAAGRQVIKELEKVGS